MPRIKKGRARSSHACLTCCLVCLVIVVLFTVGIVVGANVAFNKIVSPKIGGVTLSETISLVSGVYKSDRNKLITNEYTDKDLDDFHKSLNSALYQTIKTDEELTAEYNALSDEERGAITLEQYMSENRYNITVRDITDSIDLGGTSDNNGEDDGGDEIAAAEDSEESESGDSLTALFKKLTFDFSPLKDYPYTSGEDLTYTTFEVTANQLAAVVGEVINNLVNNLDLSQYSEALTDVKLAEFVGIPQLTTVFTEEIGSATYNESIKLSAVIELKVKDLVNAIGVPMLQEQMSNAEAVIGVVEKILPKNLYISLSVYPLNENKESELSINNYSEKQQGNLKKVINALTNGLKLFEDKEEEGGDAEEGLRRGNICYAEDEFEGGSSSEEVPSIFVQVNQLVNGVFKTIDDYIPVNFVSNEEGSATLRMAHIQAMLSLMGMYDPENIADSVTPHEFLTTLRCLIDEAKGSSNQESLDSLYDQLSVNYGVDRDYWDDHNLLDSETMDELPSVIELSKVTYRENAKMKVFMHEGQLTTLIGDAIKNGLFDSKEETAEAGDEGETDGEDLLDMISFDQILISEHLQESVYNITYINSAEEEKVLVGGIKNIYKLDIQASIDVAKLLTQNAGDNDIIDSLSKALPEKLCLAVVMYVADLVDEEGTVVKRYVGGDEAGATQFKINKYDEENTSRVITVIQKMIESFGVENEFSIESITSQLEEGFANVFNTVSDTLYCTIGFSNTDGEGNNVGSVVLPSIYEVVYGISTKKIEESDYLTLEDRLTIEETRALFVNIYNTDIRIVEYGDIEDSPEDYDIVINKYNPESGDEFLSELSSKYYLKNKLESSALFGDGGLDNLVSEDSINFKGYYDEGGVYVEGLYKDSAKSLQNLKVSLSGASLADLINSSGKLDSLSAGAGSSDYINKLEILTAGYDWSEDKSSLWLNLEFYAYFNKTIGGEGEGFTIGKFLPESVVLTARVLLYSESYDDNARFSSDVLINKDDIAKLSKLIRIFSADFSVDDIKNQVSDAIKSAFDNIEGSINITYDSESDNSLVIGNIFNTINKLSHKNDEDYVQSDDDDNKLKFELQEFGREPNYGINDENIVNSVEISYYEDGKVYSSKNADDFYDRINTNYYIKDGEEFNSEKIKESVSIKTSILDFTKLYADNRAYSEIDTSLFSLEFTAIANDLVHDQLNIEDIGLATIIQSYISEDSIKLVLKFDVKSDGASGEESSTQILPEYIFLTTYTSLTSVDSSGVKNYETEVLINSYENYNVTKDLFDRIKLLQDVLGIDFGFSLEDLTNHISDGIKAVFEEYFAAFGEVETGDNYIKLPTVFEYLTNGTIVSGEYDSTKKMFELYDKDNGYHYAVNADGIVGYNDGSFNAISVRDSSGNIVNAVAETRNKLMGYAKYDSIGHESFVVIQTHPEDLMADLREFGKMPAETKVEVNIGDKLGYYDAEYSTFRYSEADKATITYRGIDLSYTSDSDGYHAPGSDVEGDYFYDDAAAFLNLVNRNYYVKAEKEITLANLSEQMVIESSMFDFNRLYNDNRDYCDIVNELTGARLTAISNGFYESGISIDGGSAEIVQMHIFGGDSKINGYVYLRTIVRVSLVNGINSNILPEHLYVACYTNIDPEADESIRYSTELVINDFGYTDAATTLENRVNSTNEFLARLDSLKSNFNVSYNMSMDNIKVTLKDKFSDIFENKLSIFGDIRIEDDAIIIPNVFEYLTQGQLIKEGGETNYYSGEGYRMLELDGEHTTPEVFRNRLRELGRSDILNSDGSMSVWVDGKPYLGTDKSLYNDNSLNLSADSFYSEMQAYYFLKSEVSASTFTSGSDELGKLTGDLNGVFNLTGMTSTNTNSFVKAYIEKGLYNYNGEQKSPRLSDKALAALINEQSSIDLSSISSVGGVSVTSIKITNVSANTQTIEITAKVITDGSSIMPEHFYLTTTTTRTVGSGEPSYSTTVTLNRFAQDDFLNFKGNIEHIAEIGFKGKIDSDGVARAVEDALKSVFDDKLSSYQSGFGEYAIEERATSGFGYIEFKNFYDVLVEKIGATKTETSSKDIQNVIYKLHNVNQDLLANEGNVEYNLLTHPDEMTDRNMAWILSNTTSLNVCQTVIFTGTNSSYSGYEGILKGQSESFAFASGVNYILSTVKVNTSSIGADVSLLPDNIYASVLIDGDNNVKYTFLNDFNASEQSLFESFVSDDSNKLDVKGEIQEKLSALKTLYSFNDASYEQGDFINYYGKLVKNS